MYREGGGLRGGGGEVIGRSPATEVNEGVQEKRRGEEVNDPLCCSGLDAGEGVNNIYSGGLCWPWQASAPPLQLPLG